MPWVAEDGTTLSDQEMEKLTTSPVKIESPKFTPTQAIIRKYSEGLTGGLSTPVVAGIQGALTPGTTMHDEIQKAQEESKQISKEYPFLAPASEMAGVITPQGLFGKVASKVTKGLTALEAAPVLARIAGQAAGAGTMQGAKDIAENKEIKDTANDILNALALGTAGGFAGELVTGLSKGARAGGSTILASLRGIKPSSIEMYAKNPQAVNQAIVQQAEGVLIPKVSDDFNAKLGEFVRSRTEAINKALSGSTKKVDIQPILNVANQELDSISRLQTTPTKLAQIAEVKKQVNLLQKLPKEMPASDVQELKQDLQDQLRSFYERTKISRDRANTAISNIEDATREAVENVDPIIKKSNSELKEAIDLQKFFKIGRLKEEGGGLEEGQAQKILSTLLNDAKKTSFIKAKRMDELLGTDLVNSAKIFNAASDLAVKDALSSIPTGRALLGMGLGAGAGSLFGHDNESKGAYGLAGALLGSPAFTRPLITAGSQIGTAIESPIVQRGATSLFQMGNRPGGLFDSIRKNLKGSSNKSDN